MKFVGESHSLAVKRSWLASEGDFAARSEAVSTGFNFIVLVALEMSMNKQNSIKQLPMRGGMIAQGLVRYLSPTQKKVLNS